MTLTNRHLGEVCLLHHPDPTKTCRYLVNDELDPEKWYCQKLRPAAKRHIDIVISASSRKSRARLGVASGDNCEGYPLLKHVDQGFDVG
jgi:hypothetical protein